MSGGDPVPLDGGLAAELADVALRKGHELLRFADDWLVANQW
jgi:hypothetical protein